MTNKIISLRIDGSDVNTITILCDSIGCINYRDIANSDEYYIFLTTIYNKNYNPVIEFKTRKHLNFSDNCSLDTFMSNDYCEDLMDDFEKREHKRKIPMRYEISDSYDINFL